MNELITILILGITGSVHCVTMCGSLSIALGFSIPKNRTFWQYALYVSLGRVFGYGLIGMIVNLLAQSMVSLTAGGIFYLSLISGGLMIVVALHILNLTNWLSKIEKVGQWLNPLLQPLKHRLVPIDSFPKCLAYGVLWGFLPCGLVYTALSFALVSPSPLIGFSAMVLFGLTTVPALVGMTVFSTKLSQWVAKPWVKISFALIIIFSAVFQIATALLKLSSIG